MVKYVLKRLLLGLVTLFALTTITFFLMHIIPGSPFAGEFSKLPPSVKEKLVHHYGLDQPIIVQFGSYLRNIATGDFGTSLHRKGRLVTDILMAGLPASAKIGAVAFTFSMVVGITAGSIAAFSKKRWVATLMGFLTTVGISVPGFLLALLVMLLFGVILKWLPIVGLSTWKHYIMPCLALSFGPIATISRLTKVSLLDVLRQDYITLAKSKGTKNIKVIVKHALKNAIVPVTTYAGPLIATLLTGSLVVENLFSIPGIGAEFTNSVTNRDYTMIMATTIFYGAFIIIMNIVTDVAIAALDPRVRLK